MLSEKIGYEIKNKEYAMINEMQIRIIAGEPVFT
jgi:hypothetical protein